jgi:hypothetical protein
MFPAEILDPGFLLLENANDLGLPYSFIMAPFKLEIFL